MNAMFEQGKAVKVTFEGGKVACALLESDLEVALTDVAYRPKADFYCYVFNPITKRIEEGLCKVTSNSVVAIEETRGPED